MVSDMASYSYFLLVLALCFLNDSSAQSVPSPLSSSVAFPNTTSISFASITASLSQTSSSLSINTSCSSCAIALDLEGLQQVFWFTETWSVTLDTEYVTVTSINGSNATGVPTTRTVLGDVATLDLSANSYLFSKIYEMDEHDIYYLNEDATFVRGSDGSVGTTSFPFGQAFAEVTAINYRYMTSVPGCIMNEGIGDMGDGCICLMNSWFDAFAPPIRGNNNKVYTLDATYYVPIPSSQMNEDVAGQQNDADNIPWDGAAFSSWLAGNEAFQNAFPNWKDCASWNYAAGPPAPKIPCAVLTATISTTVQGVATPSNTATPAFTPAPNLPKATTPPNPGSSSSSSGSSGGSAANSGSSSSGNSGSQGSEGSQSSSGSESSSSTDSTGSSSSSSASGDGDYSGDSSLIGIIGSGDDNGSQSSGQPSGESGSAGNSGSSDNTESPGRPTSSKTPGDEPGQPGSVESSSSDGPGGQGGKTRADSVSLVSSGSKSDATFPDHSPTAETAFTASPIPIATVGSQVISASADASEVFYAGTTLSKNGQHATIENTDVYVGSSGLVIGGSSTIAIPPASNPGLSAVAIATVGSQVISASPAVSEVYYAGTTLSQDGPHATISSTDVYVGSSGLVIGGSSTVALVPVPSISSGSSFQDENGSVVFTAAGQTFTSFPSGVAVAGTSISPDSAVVISGTTISYGPGGLKIGSSIIPIPTPPPTTGASGGGSTHIFTIGGQTLTANPTAIDIDGTTLKAGAPAVTISGTPISLGSAGLVIASSTYAIRTDTLPSSTTVIDGETFTINPTAVEVAGTTLSEGGSAINVHGTPISLEPSGLVIAGSTIPYGNGPLTEPGGTSVGLGDVIMAGFGPSTTSVERTTWNTSATGSLIGFTGEALKRGVQSLMVWMVLILSGWMCMT